MSFWANARGMKGIALPLLPIYLTTHLGKTIGGDDNALAHARIPRVVSGLVYND